MRNVLGHDVGTFLQLKVCQCLFDDFFVVLDAQEFAHEHDVFFGRQSPQKRRFLLRIGQEIFPQESHVLEEIHIEGGC